MLKFCDVYYKNILKGVSFSLEKNRVTLLVGKNGCGKSTLLSLLYGGKKYSGNILLKDKNIREYSPRERAEELCFLPQILPSVHMTVLELCSIAKCSYSVSSKSSDEDVRQIQEALKMCCCEQLANRYCDELSGGERQRAFLCFALCQNTDLMLLDEPSTYLDIKGEEELLRLLNKIKTEKTVLAVMHDLNAAVNFADNIIVLDEGKIAFAGSAKKCIDSKILERVFSVRTYIAQNKIFFGTEGDL